MKPEPQTELGRWMRQNRYSDQTFADAISEELQRLAIGRPTRRSVTGSAVAKWRLGTAIPRKLPLRAIKNLTGLTADSFVQEPA